MTKTKVGILGAYTIDEIKDVENNKFFVRAGGAPIYSGLGIYVAGGEAHVFTSKGKDFVFDSPNYISSEYVKLIDKTLRFEILLSNNGRKLRLKNAIEKIDLKYEEINKLDGIIVNPVCKEVDSQALRRITIPIAIDLQGFVRNCIEEKEITYEKVSLYPNTYYSVIHANYEEQNNSGLEVNELFDLGFKEIIISYGEEGFILYTKHKIYKMKNDIKGSFEIGNGDFLLGYYFTLRLKRIEIEKAINMAYSMAIKFATYGPNLSLLLK